MSRSMVMKRSVSVDMRALALQALSNGSGEIGGPPPAAAVDQAVRCYLGDRDRGGVGWACPTFLPEDANGGGPEPLSITLEDSLWAALEQEAETQGVSSERLLEHAILYFAAELDAGRITRRIGEEE